MKIVQVVTYVDGDGSFGGPLSVAALQSQGLAARGHEVHLVAGWDGEAGLEIKNVSVHLARARRLTRDSFAGTFSRSLPGLVHELARDADVLQLHFARDLIQLSAAASSIRARAALVLQAHGMIVPDPRLLARMIDAILVRKTYRRAQAHLVLTQNEADAAQRIGRRRLPIFDIRNGVAVPSDKAVWKDSTPVVTFLARFSRRKRPLAFIEMAKCLTDMGVPASFRMYGPDEGELHSVQSVIRSLNHQGVDIAYHGPVPPGGVESVLKSSQVYVLPSVKEPFPMSLLEAMANGVPSVITDDTGLSEELERRGSARVTSGSPAAMAQAVADLIQDETAWREASVAALEDVNSWFSHDAMVDRLEEIYNSVCSPVTQGKPK